MKTKIIQRFEDPLSSLSLTLVHIQSNSSVVIFVNQFFFLLNFSQISLDSRKKKKKKKNNVKKTIEHTKHYRILEKRKKKNSKYNAPI